MLITIYIIEIKIVIFFINFKNFFLFYNLNSSNFIIITKNFKNFKNEQTNLFIFITIYIIKLIMKFIYIILYKINIIFEFLLIFIEFYIIYKERNKKIK